MKRTASLLLAFLLLAALSGCGKTPAAPTEPSRTELGSEEADLAAEYLDALRPQLKELEAPLLSMATLDCAMEGGDLVIFFRFKENVTVSEEAIDGVIGSSDGAVYRQMFDAFAAYMHNDDVRIVVRGLNADGKTLFERIVDKTFTPDETDAATDAVSLSEYVYSATFQNSISAQGSEVLSVWAEVEDDNVMAVYYEYADPLTDEQKTVLRERLANDADGALAAGAQELLAMVREAVVTENVTLVYRWTDPTEEIIAEQKFE